MAKRTVRWRPWRVKSRILLLLDCWIFGVFPVIVRWCDGRICGKITSDDMNEMHK